MLKESQTKTPHLCIFLSKEDKTVFWTFLWKQRLSFSLSGEGLVPMATRDRTMTQLLGDEPSPSTVTTGPGHCECPADVVVH